MNDFTKEELEKIFYYVDVTSHIQDDDEQKLLNKIQSMIDNYCEHECNHESDGYDYFKIGEDELLMDVLKTRKNQLKCRKCQRIYNDNQ